MKPIFVQSIPHTGTFFCFDHLFANWRRAEKYPMLREGEKWRMHFGEPVELPQGDFLTVVPLRNPIAVAQSWIHRGLDLSKLAAMFLHAEALRNVFFLPIDSPRKHEYLAALTRAVGHELETDWRKINSEPAYDPRISDDALSISREFSDLTARFW